MSQGLQYINVDFQRLLNVVEVVPPTFEHFQSYFKGNSLGVLTQDQP